MPTILVRANLNKARAIGNWVLSLYQWSIWAALEGTVIPGRACSLRIGSYRGQFAGRSATESIHTSLAKLVHFEEYYRPGPD